MVYQYATSFCSTKPLHTHQDDQDRKGSLFLQPQFLVPRQHVPLSYLDLSCSSGDPPPARQFFSDCRELAACLGGTSPQLLVATAAESGGTLFVIEHILDRAYTLCRLSQSVSLESLQAACRVATPLKQPSETPLRPHPAKATRKILAQDSSSSESQVHIKKEESQLSALDSQDTSTELEVNESALPLETTIDSPQAEALDPLHNPVDQQIDLDLIAHDIALQYLEVLYLSKASLGYFLKGALSRARALVSTSHGSVSTYEGLASALRAMVMTPSSFDRKYSSKLPEMLKVVLVNELELASDGQPARPRLRKAKTLKKPKPNKHGVYSNESEYLAKWWHKSESKEMSEVVDDALKKHLSGLRLRESLLQILLALEVIAAEKEIKDKKRPEGVEASVEEPPAKVAKKSKPANDLHSTLDMLVDRVCIWQSVDPSSDSPVKDRQIVGQAKGATSTTGPTDRLKEFCVEILIPFFSSRLPTKIDEIAKAMGVKTQSRSDHAHSDPRKRQRKEAVAPGSKVNRDILLARRQSTVSQGSRPGTSLGHAKKASLTRSTTDSLLQELKRERSHTPLDERTSARRGLSRSSSIAGGKSFSQREVDLSALKEFQAKKEQKKHAVDQELESAISLLKKPNRSVAAKQFADAAERRAPSGPAKRSSFKSRLGVEIGVTPRKEEKTFQMGAFAKPPMPQLVQHVEASPVRIPSTNPASGVPSTSKPAGNAAAANIFETPSRGPSKTFDAFAHRADLVPDSAVKQVRSLSPSLLKKKPTGPPSSSAKGKEADNSAAVQQVDTTPLRKESQKDTSIYDVLGWDDGEDDELL